MNPDDQRPRALALSAAIRVDEACERFESAWRRGQFPSLTAFLQGHEGAERSALLAELRALQAELTSGVAEPEPDEAPTRRFGDYELLAELGQGGMGVVYRARQIGLNRVVALKLIRSGPFASEAETRRFRVEAEAAAHLDHPHIVPIYEVGRHGGASFFSMKYVSGGSLDQHLSRYVGDGRAAARMMVWIARAVQFAHERGVIHRDLKPSNILLDDRKQPLVADFGLAKRIDRAEQATVSGALVGTPAFMAPEQADGGRASAQADIYSLGAILFQLLTGRPPFRGATIAEVLAQVRSREPEPPRLIRPGVPRELESICLVCLEKRPEARYASAADLADDLERFLRGEGVHAGRPGPAALARRWARREPEIAARLVGQAAVIVLTQVNYLLTPEPDLSIHAGVTAAEFAWLFTTWLFHRLGRGPGGTVRVRPAWIAVDVGVLTMILRVLNAAAGPLVIGYAPVVASSGLWSRVRLVWLTTGLSMLGYGVLAFDAWRRGVVVDSNHHPNIVLAVLAVLGFVVAGLVRRIVALSSADEHPGPAS